MEKFALTLYSLKFNTIIEIGYTEHTSQVIFDFMSIFNVKINNENRTLNLEYKHQYTEKVKKKINSFILNYKVHSPQIQQINKYFKQLKSDEYFFILPSKDFNTKEKLGLETELYELNGYKSYSDAEKIQLKQFDCILNNYELIGFNLEKNKITPIGTRQKNKRICRFCKKSQPDVSFNNIAHAISEGLGNKKLILNEECDTCNKFFDENIERDFIYYHDLARTAFGIKNKKNNIPKMKGKDFQFFKDIDNNNLTIAIVQNIEKHNQDEPPKNILFKTGNKIQVQNIYKTLSKFALSIIDDQYIKNFDETISWLKNKKEINKLPKIAVLNDYHFFTKVPELTLYLRNNDNKKIPYLVGEFKFTFYMYIFIVPFSSEDNQDFLFENEYKDFLNCFKHVKNINKFRYLDFSNNISKELNFNINFEQRKN